MTSITATAARKDIYNLIANVNENCAPIAIITSKGKGAVLIGEDEWSAIEETLYLNSIPGMADIIVEGLNTPISERIATTTRNGSPCGKSSTPSRPTRTRGSSRPQGSKRRPGLLSMWSRRSP